LSRCQGRFSTKTYTLVDALGLPIKFILSPGQSSEIKQAPELIKGMEGFNIWEDKAFNSDEFVQQIFLSYLSALLAYVFKSNKPTVSFP
jgi:transposase